MSNHRDLPITTSSGGEVRAPGLTVHFRPGTGTMTIAVTADIDCATAPVLQQRLLSIITASAAAHVVLDLADIEFCDSAAIRALSQLRQAAAGRGIDCHIRHARPHIAWLIRTLDAADLLDPTGDVGHA